MSDQFARRFLRSLRATFKVEPSPVNRRLGSTLSVVSMRERSVLGFLGVGATGATAPGTTTVRTVMPAARALVAEGRST